MKLVIAEKPSVARSIAEVLGATVKGDGFLSSAEYIVSWCIGHLIELAPADTYDGKFAKWRREDLPILPGHWHYVVPKDKEKQLKILRGLMVRKDVDTVICATDAGREGELIFRLVYTHCDCKKPVQRLWVSSMEESAIVEGFRALKDGAAYDNLYQSALCRSRADWLVGINATRLFSVLYRRTLNVGRVITPTLALIVRREAEIDAFRPKPYYTVQLDCGSFMVSGEKLADRKTAEGIRAACDGKAATVITVERKEKTEQSPKLYDLTTLQREANRLHGYTAQQTLDYVQALYEKKLCTYPRTDSRHLTEDMAAGLPALVSFVAAVLPFTGGLPVPVNAGQVINNAGVSDHHAIIPTPTMAEADLSTLPAGERSVLHMIAVRLICAVGDKHQYAETVVTLDCAGHGFMVKGKTVLSPGWKAVVTLKSTSEDEKDNDAKALPVLTQRQAFEAACATVKECKTTPPKHFSEDTLLSAMETAGTENAPKEAERKGLGTPATRAGIIEKLIKSGLAERREAKKAKHLIPTEKGAALIAVLPEQLKSPALTTEWEEQLKQVERGALSSGDFIAGIATMIRELVQTYEPLRLGDGSKTKEVLI